MRTTSRLILAAALLSLTSACAFQTQTRAVNMNAVAADPAASRMTNFMDAPQRMGSPTEQTPGSISRSAIIDEAVISRLTSSVICFDVVLRTHVSLDVPLTQWDVTLNERQELYFEEGPITVVDYPFNGERVVFAADAVLPEAFGSLRLTEPTKEVYRVYERSGTVCGNRPATRKVTLTLRNPQNDLRGDWGETYTWTLN